MPIRDRWIDSRGVRLHALESVPDATAMQIPLLVIPGVFGTAEDYRDEMTRLQPRPCLAVSLRGRGRSDVPAGGYRLEDHLTDIAATMADWGHARVAIMGYAIGGAYATAYALGAPAKIAGLIIGDYPARYRALPEKWVASALKSMGERARPEVARALQAESAQLSMWERLGELSCPVAVLYGAQAGSMVTAEVIAQYREHLPAVEMLILENNGHELWKPDFDSYLDAIANFLTRIDAKSASTKS